jgi:hypothetical protein
LVSGDEAGTKGWLALPANNVSEYSFARVVVIIRLKRM